MPNPFSRFNNANIPFLESKEESEKKLALLATQLAPALEAVLDGTQRQRYGFALFICDYKTGAIQYISNGHRDDWTMAIGQWIDEQKAEQNVTAKNSESKLT